MWTVHEIAKQIGASSPALVVGAGAGPWPTVGSNSELMINVWLDGDCIDVKSQAAKVNPDTKQGEAHVLDTDQLAFMANLYVSRGDNLGKVCL